VVTVVVTFVVKFVVTLAITVTNSVAFWLSKTQKGWRAIPFNVNQ
jgi:hypothetical protein